MPPPPPPSRRLEAEPGEASVDPQDLAVRAAALLPDRLLQGGEIIVLLLKPHWLYILLGPLKTLVALGLITGVGAYIAGEIGASDTRQKIVVAGLLLVLARLFWQFLEWLSRVYVMTDQRLIAVSGVLRVRVFETPLTNVTHSELLFSLRERVAGLGTLAFYTAGSGVAEAYWVMIAKPLEVHATIVQTLRRYRR